jgi:cell wall-associated NlpC family hydrolase
MSGSASGLSDAHRAHARKLVAENCRRMVANKNSIHYTQSAARWEGIRLYKSAVRDTYPKHADCSSTHTWLMWDAMHRPYGVRDLVNRLNWKAGYTGTMYKRGKAVEHDENLKIGDAIFYGDQGGGIPEHVATYVGGGKVFSHGSEGGPYILGLDYRSDRRMSRRYI